MRFLHHQKGYSLIELMIGMTIGLLLLSGLTYLVVHSTTSRSELDKSMQQVENGRYAMQLLHDDIRMAGFYGDSWSVGNAPSVMPDPCATDIAALTTAMPMAVQGYSQVTTPISCINSNDILQGTDVLVIRRALTTSLTVAGAQANSVYIQTNGGSFILDAGGSANFTLQNQTSTSTTAALLYPYTVRIYFVSKCDVYATSAASCTTAADGGTPIPTLKRLELPAADATWLAPVPLVEGVEQLHVEYGIDADADGTPDTYVNLPATPSDWSNVTAIKISILVRNTSKTTGFVDTKSYALGSLQIPNSALSDVSYKRHVFTSAIGLTNVRGRRDK